MYYNRVHYWMRILMITVVSLALDLEADKLLNVPVLSGRDHLLYFTIFCLLYYFFGWRWLIRQKILSEKKDQ